MIESKLSCYGSSAQGNEITSECRASEGLHFEVDLTSSVPSSIVIRVLQAGGPSPDSDTWSYNTLYLWSVPQMAERLERMRPLPRGHGAGGAQGCGSPPRSLARGASWRDLTQVASSSPKEIVR